MSLYEILTLLLGGGIGSIVTWFINLKSNKKIKDAEALEAQTHADKDRFDALTIQCNNLMKDYTELSTKYRQALDMSNDKCAQLAEMKAQLRYLKGLRCYNTECPYRVKNNPDKLN